MSTCLKFPFFLQQCIESALGNVAVSPNSAVNAIILLSQTTNGKTSEFLKKQLNFTGSDAELLDNYVAYHKSLAKSARSSTFIVANKLFLQNWYKVDEKFQEIATQKLLSGVEAIDLSNSVKAAKTINDFVVTETQNKTGDIINPEFLSVNHPRIILMNTIYMKLNFDKVNLNFRLNDCSCHVF